MIRTWYSPPIRMIALPEQWNAVESVSPDVFPEELEGPISLGPGGEGHNMNCWSIALND